MWYATLQAGRRRAAAALITAAACLLTAAPTLAVAAEVRISFTQELDEPDLPEVAMRSLRRALPPGLLTRDVPGANPSFVQDGFRVEAFWAVRIGRPDAHFIRGHFHPRGLGAGYEGQHFGNRDELHGIYIKAIDGRRFSLRSLKYRVTTNRELGQDRSIEGFSNANIEILITEHFFPSVPAAVQFRRFPVGPPIGSDPQLTFFTLPVSGFEDVLQVFIASSGSVDFTDIVLSDD